MATSTVFGPVSNYTTLDFCEPGDHYSTPWLEGGFSRCFLEIVGSISSTGVLMLLGLTIIILGPKSKKTYNKNSVPGNRTLLLSKILIADIVVCVTLALTYVVDLVVKGTLRVVGEEIYGYTIVEDSLGIISWLFSIFMLFRERVAILKGKSHGISLALFWVLNVAWLGLEIVSFNSPFWWWRLRTRGDISDLVLYCVRAISLCVIVALGILRPLCCPPKTRPYTLLVNAETDEEDVDTEERNKESRERKEGSFIRKRTTSAFSDFWMKAKLLFPYVWPKGQYLLQLRVVVCFLILVAGRVINVFVPIYYKEIVNSLTPNVNQTSSFDVSLNNALGIDSSLKIVLPLAPIFIYVLLKFLQGGSVGSTGLVNNMRSYLWITVQQYTARALRVNLLKHLHGLSLRWHLGRKTGEVLRVMDRGSQSITSLLSYILFNIAPTLVDIAVAVVYFVIAFDGWFGLIVFLTMISYILFTISITEWRTKYRRVMNERDNATRAKAVDSLLNFETVKYYGAEQYEVNRYNDAIVNYQNAEWKSLASLNVLGLGQNFIITLGLLCGSILCAQRVVDPNSPLKVGDFVLYNTYIIQLYAPLNFFGTYYLMIQQAFVDMENMFDLLDVDPEVKDTGSANALQIAGAKVEFRNVYFHYVPEKPILRDVSFTVEAGETVALVGPSGAGKSTIIRLLFRFYDIQDGVICIDGQDLKQVQQISLRKQIGVVPQDTVLFNDNIRYNVRYGNVEASDDEVEQAARYADIHKRIESFPQQYNTVVGERGLKLSGGEKQRVCIARTILKNPAVILLDEATSALDTETERNIQSSLMQVCQGRTTIIVAHRLSTIIHANQILVLKDGEVVERGTHDHLLATDGVYASMWAQQQQSLEVGGAGGDQSDPRESAM